MKSSTDKGASSDSTKKESEEEKEESSKLDAEAAKAAKATEAVTDHVAEREGGDIASAVEAEQSLSEYKPKESSFTGSINAEDLAVVMEECDMSKDDADTLLKRADGSLEKALELFVTTTA